MKITGAPNAHVPVPESPEEDARQDASSPGLAGAMDQLEEAAQDSGLFSEIGHSS